MDLIRSCYTVGMRFSLTSGVVPVKWFFAAPKAKYLGVPTAFYSRNWEDAAAKFDDAGEQPGPRRWFNGQRPALAIGQYTCDADEDFLLGLAPGATLNRDVVAGPVPVCCLDPKGAGTGGEGGSTDGATVWGASGGAVGGGVSSWQKEGDMPALYKKTILTNPTPGATFNGIHTTQIWCLRLQVTPVGPGGGGGGAAGGVSTSAGAGGGSCGATKLQFWLGVFNATPFPYQIGGYGPGGAAGNNPGTDGTADTVFTGPTTVTAQKGKGGAGSPAVPFITGGIFNRGGAPPPGGNPGFPGVVMPGPSGNTPLGGAGGCSTVGGAGDFQYASNPGNDATPDTGSGGGGAVAASGSMAGGKGADGLLVVEEWNF